MKFSPKVTKRMINYTPEQYEAALTRIDRSADEYLFGMLHGDLRTGYATRFMGIRTTYEELDTEIERVARALFAFGLRQGDTISISLPNVKESILYIYACWRIGVTANLIDPRTNGQGILERVRTTNSKLLVIIMDVCDPKIDEVLNELPVEHVIIVSPKDSLKVGFKLIPTLGVLAYTIKGKKFAEGRMDQNGKYIWHADFIENNYTDLEDIRAVYSPDLIAAITYTSGTASDGDGKIKGAALTHRAFNSALCAFRCVVDPIEYQPGDTFGGFVPFFSAYGAVCGMHASLCGALEVILVPIFDQEKFAKFLLKIKPNIFLSVPRFLEQLSDYPKLKKKNNLLSFIHIAIAGGDKISGASMERVNETLKRGGCDCGVRVGYGSTELGGSIAVMPRYNPETSKYPWQADGNVGTVMPHCKAMVIDPDTGKELPIGEVGELCVNSVSQMEYYVGRPDATEEITIYGADGTKYYKMGDKGRLDENGIFYFVDRYKRSIMRLDGHTVHPSPIENVIMMHDAVEICAVAGLSKGNDSSGTIASAFVVLRKSEIPQEQILKEIDTICLKHLPERDRAVAYKVVAELPYTPMGKIHFRELSKEIFKPEEFFIVDRRACMLPEA